MLVEIAGIDGSGKSTIIDAIAGWSNGIGLFTFEQIFRSSTRRLIHALNVQTSSRVLDALKGDPVELAVCVELVREANSVPVIQVPGNLVLVDNYVRGWLANVVQSGATVLDEIALIYAAAVPLPQLCIELEVPAEVAHARILSRPKRDPAINHGGADFLRKRATAFRETRGLVKYPTEIVDAEQAPEILVERALGLIVEYAKATDELLYRKIKSPPAREQERIVP